MINLDVSIVQTATMLDEAATRAIQDGNVEAMLAVAAGWLEFGSRMLGPTTEEDEEEDEHELETDTKIMGFASSESREVMESEKQENRRKAGL